MKKLEGLIDFSKWGVKEYVEVVPPVFSVVIVLMVIIFFPGDMGMLGVSVLLALMVGAFPYIFYRYYRISLVRAMEENLPNFLRDLVENKKSGMTLPQAIGAVTKIDYGKLSPEIKKMYHQLTWGVPFDKVLKMFAERVGESVLISRTMRIIIEAQKSGGNIISSMETIASDISIIKEAEKERKSRMTQHVAVMYLIYFMFLAIAIVLTKVLISLRMGEGLGMVMGSGTGDPCSISMGAAGTFVCDFFRSICDILGAGTGGPCFYRALFFSMAMVQAFFSGLIIGQIGEESYIAGIKHSLILVGIGFAIFVLLIKLGVA